MEANKELQLFHTNFCPDVPINSPQVFIKLLEEINKEKIEEST